MMMLALLLGSADPVAAAVATMTPEQKAAQLQSTAPADAAAGLPAYDWWNEGLHGLARNGPATVFPQAIGLAATWDVALMQDRKSTRLNSSHTVVSRMPSSA